MYKLPIFLLIDRSASIQGSHIFAQSNSIDVLIEDLGSMSGLAPWVSVLTFNTSVTIQRGLVPLEDVDLPPLVAGVGSSDLGAGLLMARHLADDWAKHVDALDPDPWLKPKLLIFTDGDVGSEIESNHWERLRGTFDTIIYCSQNVPRFTLPSYVVSLFFSQLRGGTFTSCIR